MKPLACLRQRQGGEGGGRTTAKGQGHPVKAKTLVRQDHWNWGFRGDWAAATDDFQSRDRKTEIIWNPSPSHLSTSFPFPSVNLLAVFPTDKDHLEASWLGSQGNADCRAPASWNTGQSRGWMKKRYKSSYTIQYRRLKRHVFNPWVGKISWRRAWQPTPVFLPGEFHGQRSLAGYIQSTESHRVEHDWCNSAWHGMAPSGPAQFSRSGWMPFNFQPKSKEIQT